MKAYQQEAVSAAVGIAVAVTVIVRNQDWSQALSETTTIEQAPCHIVRANFQGSTQAMSMGESCSRLEIETVIVTETQSQRQSSNLSQRQSQTQRLNEQTKDWLVQWWKRDKEIEANLERGWVKQTDAIGWWMLSLLETKGTVAMVSLHTHS